MPGPLIMIPCLALGVLLATWGRTEAWWKASDDRMLFFFGIVLGSTIGWAIADPWFALGIPVAAALIVLRRRRTKRPESA